MKIWQATESDTQIRFYWFATKREALDHKKSYDHDPPFDGATCEISPFLINSSKIGIVAAMNWVISLTCFNEG